MADDDKDWEDVPAKKSGGTATATADGDWEDVSTKGASASTKPTVAKMQPPTRFEQENTPKPYLGFTPGNMLSNAWEGAKGLVKSGAGALYDTTLGEPTDTGEMEHGLGGLIGLNAKGEFAPLQRAGAITRKYITDPMATEINKAQDESAHGHTLGAIGHYGAATIPVLGPWAASLGEQAGTGDVGGAVGQAAGTIGAGELLPKIAKNIPGVTDKIVRGTPITEAGKLEAAKQQALTVKKPSMTETEYAGQVNDALPDLQKIAQDNKGKIKTPRQAVQGINSRISEIEQPIREHLENLPANEVVHPDQYVPQVKAAVDQALSGKSGSYTPQEIEKARNNVLNFIGEDVKRPIEIERNRTRLNQDADAYYHSDTAGKRAIDVSDATAVAQRAAANKIRDILYGDDQRPGALENFGVSATDATGQQVPIRNVRKQVGNLINVRDHFEDAITRAEATGDWKAFDKWRSGPSLAAGGLGVLGGGAVGGPIGAVFGALAGEGVKAWADYLKSKNPNLNTEKMFRNLADTSAPNVSQVQTRAPIRQYQQPVAPQVPQYLGAIGPEIPSRGPGEFPLHDVTPPAAREGMWQPQVGAPPDLGWGGPTSPYREPIGPKFQEEPHLGRIGGEQQSLNLPPENAPLFNIQTPNPRGRVPELQKLGGVQDVSNPQGMEQQGLGAIGGPGRQGTLGKIGETKNVAPSPVEKVALPHPEATDLKPAESTSDRFYNKDTDEWTPEREANHDAVADAAIKGKTPPVGREPEAIITMGGTASGKTTLTRQILGADNNRVNVDSDLNKLTIPEYEGLKESDPDNAAARVHEESKAISWRTMKKAINKGLDFVYDSSTGGGGSEGGPKLVKKLKDLGYNVKLVYADVPVKEAIKRAKERAESSEDPTNRGRIIPEDVIRDKHVEAAKAFNTLRNSPHVDEVRAFDTTTRTPEEFYNRKGEKETVHNPKTLDRIKEKANGQTTAAK